MGSRPLEGIQTHNEFRRSGLANESAGRKTGSTNAEFAASRTTIIRQIHKIYAVAQSVRDAAAASRRQSRDTHDRG